MYVRFYLKILALYAFGWVLGRAWRRNPHRQDIAR